MSLSASQILRSMESRQRMASLQAIDDLPYDEREAVVAALSSVPGRRKVDLGKLISEVRQQTYLRQAQPVEPDHEAAFRYFASCLTPEERQLLIRAKLRADSWDEAIRLCQDTLARNRPPSPRDVRGRVNRTQRLQPPPNRNLALPESSKRFEAEDELPDDDWLTSDEHRPRRQIKRYRPHAQRANVKPQERPSRSRLLGCQPLGPATDRRPYGCPHGADYEKWSRPSMPSWLLPDDDDEDDDECP